MLGSFIENYRDNADAIKQAITAEDFTTAKRLTHSLKSVAATLGATAVKDTAKTLNSVLTECNENDCILLIEQLANQLMQVEKAISVYLSEFKE